MKLESEIEENRFLDILDRLEKKKKIKIINGKIILLSDPAFSQP